MDYTAFKNAWNSATQPPAGVTGQGLSANDTPGQKIAKINTWTVAAPQKALLAPSQILNAVVFADLAALTQLQVLQLSLLLSGSQVDASVGTPIRLGIQALFNGRAATLAALGALVAPFDNATKSWCEANGYPVAGSAGNLSLSDVANAGVS